MPELDITAPDVTDASEVDAWIDVIDRSTAACITGYPAESRAGRIVGLLRDSNRDTRFEALSAKVDGRVVAAARLLFPLRDNRHVMELELDVDPALRGRGIGAAMLREIESRARADGRTSLICFTPYPVEGGQPCDAAGERFAVANGYVRATTELRSRVDLNVDDPAEQDALLARARESSAEYEVIGYTGAAPDELVDGIAYLEGRLNVDAPSGDLDFEAENVDARRHRASEARRHAKGGLTVGTAMRHRVSGRVAGFTFVEVPAGHEHDAQQGITLVDPRDRGHRIGTVLKIENHRRLREWRPRVRYVHTWNDTSNDHMVAINRALGFEPMEGWAAMQRRL